MQGAFRLISPTASVGITAFHGKKDNKTDRHALPPQEVFVSIGSSFKTVRFLALGSQRVRISRAALAIAILY